MGALQLVSEFPVEYGSKQSKRAVPVRRNRVMKARFGIGRSYFLSSFLAEL
jgi:hypothetical protein